MRETLEGECETKDAREGGGLNCQSSCCNWITRDALGAGNNRNGARPSEYRQTYREIYGDTYRSYSIAIVTGLNPQGTHACRCSDSYRGWQHFESYRHEK